MKILTNNISIWCLAASAVIAVLLFVYLAFYQENDKEALNNVREAARRRRRMEQLKLEQDEDKRKKWEKRDKFLKSSGLYYMTGGRMSLKQYRTLSVVIVVLFALLGYSIFGIIGCIAGAVLGIALPTAVLKESNNQDNNAMLSSIKDVYDTIRIQTNNDAFITDAIYEAYIVAKHPRLKQALYELIIDVNGHGDIDEAVNSFNEKFQSPYIDSLSVSIRQALISGSASRIFNDVSKQIDAIDEAIIIREEEKAQKMNTIVQALVYVVILAMVFYMTILGASDIFTIF